MPCSRRRWVLLHIPPLVYVWTPFYKRAFRTLFYERRVTTGVVDATLGISSLLFTTVNPNILVIGALSGWLYALTNRVVTRTRNRTRASLTDLFGERPEQVWIYRDGAEVQVPFESVQVGDVVVVAAGQTIPVDGRVCRGAASVDQRVLTGEAQPVEKGTGDIAYAATVVLAGTVHLEVEKTGRDTVATQIGLALDRTADFVSSVQLRGRIFPIRPLFRHSSRAAWRSRSSGRPTPWRFCSPVSDTTCVFLGRSAC